MSPPTTSHSHKHSSTDCKMQPQDSGSESQLSSSSPRHSIAAHSQRAPAQRHSNSSLKRSRTRPTTHASSTGSSPSISHAYAYPARSSTSNSHPATISPSQQQVMAMLQFSPTSDLSSETLSHRTEEPAGPPLPQTTHYWTSDSTRRMEYAAIDAASRGFRGWIRKHVLPECFLARERHLAFDDDSGSVRRYRLELADEDDEDLDVHDEKSGAKPKRVFSTDTLTSSLSGAIRTRGLSLKHTFLFKP